MGQRKYFFTRDEFLAHAQLRINDALNRKAVSADESTVAASTLGVNTKLFARTVGSAMSAIHTNSEVFSFDYYKNASDPTAVDTENDLNKKYLAYSYYNSSPSLSVFDNKLSSNKKREYDRLESFMTKLLYIEEDKTEEIDR